MYLRNVIYAITILAVMAHHAAHYPIVTMNVYALQDIMEKIVTLLLMRVMETPVQTRLHAKFWKQDDLRKSHFLIIFIIILVPNTLFSCGITK